MNVVGLDLHKSYAQVAILDKETGVLDDFRVDSSASGLRTLVEMVEPGTRVALEACSHWGWALDLLQESGLDVMLSHPSKTKAIGSAKIKTDKIDARMLACLLAADLLPEAHAATPQVRELRSYLRYRYGLVTMRTIAKNRVHAILAGYGLKCPTKDLFCAKGRKWLSSQKLRSLHREIVDGHLEIIDLLDRKVTEVDERLAPIAEQDAQAMIVDTVPGIGYYSALLIVAEIDGAERFASAKCLVSYAGLCPSTRSSGGKEWHGHITKMGSRYLRWILIEAAQKAAWPTSPLHRFYRSIARRKGNNSAKAAVARKLLESIYQMLKTGKPFDVKVWIKPTG